MSIEATIMGYFREYDALARSKYPAYAAKPIPKVTFFTKGRANGWARQKAWEVSFNIHVAAQTPDEFRNTVSHEIAHMVDFAMRGRSGHDRIWKVIHRSLGGTADRCTQYGSAVKPIAGRVTNWYLYRNASGAELWIGPKHHAALRRRKYTHIRNTVTGQKFTVEDFTGQSKKRG